MNPKHRIGIFGLLAAALALAPRGSLLESLTDRSVRGTRRPRFQPPRIDMQTRGEILEHNRKVTAAHNDRKDRQYQGFIERYHARRLGGGYTNNHKRRLMDGRGYI